MLSYKFRLYPSKNVEQELQKHLELCRWLYNKLLEETNNSNMNKNETQNLIVKLKKEENPALKKVYSKVLQMVNYTLWSNIRSLAELKKNGRKTGNLRFKGKGWFKTLNYNQSGFKLTGDKLVLSKIGEIPIKMHREIKGEIKSVVIKRERSGKWHAIFQVEGNAIPSSKTDRVVGIDVGVKHFLTDSDGRQVENPHFYEKSLERVKIEHRKLSKKEKNSKNREKQKVKLARAYEKLVNQRDDFLHKLSRFYINNYDVIAIEDLNTSGMVRSNLAKRILDASWSKFFQFLFYKAESAGRAIIKVNPKGTSREYKNGELDRDYNASLNILQRGLSGLGQPIVPVEIRPLLRVSAQAVVAGQVLSMKQEAPCES